MTVLQFPKRHSYRPSRPRPDVPPVPAIANVVADAAIRAFADAMAIEGVPDDMRDRVIGRLWGDDQKEAR